MKPSQRTRYVDKHGFVRKSRDWTGIFLMVIYGALGNTVKPSGLSSSLVALTIASAAFAAGICQLSSHDVGTWRHPKRAKVYIFAGCLFVAVGGIIAYYYLKGGEKRYLKSHRLDALLANLKRPDRQVRLAVIDAFAQLGEEADGAVPTLAWLRDSDNDEEVRRSAAQAIATIQGAQQTVRQPQDERGTVLNPALQMGQAAPIPAIGAQQEPATLQQASQPSVSEAIRAVRYCWRCGCSRAPEAAFCHGCGTPFGSNSAAATLEEASPALAEQGPSRPAPSGEFRAAEFRPIEAAEIPDSVARQLQPGEIILARLRNGPADFYATSARLLRYNGRRDAESVPYQSLRIAKKGLGFFLGVCRALLVVLGLSCTTTAVFYGFIGPNIDLGSPLLRSSMPAGLVYFFLGMGLICLFATVSVAGYRYEIGVIGPTGKVQRKWRLHLARWGSGDVRRFASVLQERAG